MAIGAAPSGWGQARQGVSALIAFSDGRLRWVADGNLPKKPSSFVSLFAMQGFDSADILPLADVLAADCSF